MTIETITLKILKASDGMILTDGKEYGSIIHIGQGRKEEEFYEITKEEYDEMLRANMPEDIPYVEDNNSEEVIGELTEE